MAANLKLRDQKTRGHFDHDYTWDLCNIPFCNLPKRLGYGVIAAASIACYLNSLEYDLVHDDVFAIKENLDVRPETPLRKLLRNDFWGKPMLSNTSHKSYRPLCTLTFRMNYVAHGLKPFGYHAVNVILHCMVCLLYTFMCNMVAFKSFMLAVLAGLLFSTHPVHTEAVSCIRHCFLNSCCCIGLLLRPQNFLYPPPPPAASPSRSINGLSDYLSKRPMIMANCGVRIIETACSLWLVLERKWTRAPRST